MDAKKLTSHIKHTKPAKGTVVMVRGEEEALVAIREEPAFLQVGWVRK